MTDPPTDTDDAERETIRLNRAVVLRIVGSATVLLALIMVAVSVLAALFGAPAALLVALILLGLSALLGLYWWLRYRTYVLRMDSHGYQIGLVRGAGATEATWREVREIVATTEHGTDLLRLELADGRTSSIPVRALAADADLLVSRVRQRAQTAHGLRAIDGE